MILEVISFLNIIQTPCAVVMMPIPRCRNPVMKWISREEKEEKVPPTDTLSEREGGKISCMLGKEEAKSRAGGQRRRKARFVNAEHLFASSTLPS